MSRFHSYINSAAAIISAYSGDEPFSSFLKKYFAANKRFGSKDRKQVGHLCYCYFRTARLAVKNEMGERILQSLFLCSSESNELLAALKPDLNDKISLPLAEKCSISGADISLVSLFPWKEELSSGIEYEKFCGSFLSQPDLFIRIRPGYDKTVLIKLQDAKIPFEKISKDCLALPNTSKLEAVLELNKEAVIQDYSSQRVGEFLKMVKPDIPDLLKVWDCCAASGGKSILAKDILGNIKLSVSDVRESILVNLKKRFSQAGIAKYGSFECDLAHSPFTIHHSPFDLIICDTPCTGSGTWARTPEQLYYFDEKKIAQYADLQKKILSNVIPHLSPGGFFLYITCSVFKKENEEAAEFIKEQFHLQLIKMELLKGYDKKADTMFAALLQKPL